MERTHQCVQIVFLGLKQSNYFLCNISKNILIHRFLYFGKISLKIFDVRCLKPKVGTCQSISSSARKEGNRTHHADGEIIVDNVVGDRAVLVRLHFDGLLLLMLLLLLELEMRLLLLLLAGGGTRRGGRHR